MISLERLFAIQDQAINLKYTDNAVVLELLRHIDAIQKQSAKPAYRVVYEVYRVGADRVTAYKNRTTICYKWTRAEAIAAAKLHKCHYNALHVVQVGDKWHRLNASELAIEGDADKAMHSLLQSETQ